MSQDENVSRRAESLTEQGGTEGLRFGRGVVTGRVLTVLIVSMIGGAIAVAVVYAIG